MKKKDGTTRWSQAEQFKKEHWSKRNESLFALLQEAEIDTSNMTFIEYGCGPYRPFSEKFGDKFKASVSCDIKLWKEGDRVVNLNNPDVELPTGDIAVLSGVLEYLNDPARVLEKLIANYTYVLMSYKVIEETPGIQQLLRSLFRVESLLDAKVKKIKQRAVGSGMRNHLCLNELLGMLFGKAYVENIDLWNSHVLLLIKNSTSSS